MNKNEEQAHDSTGPAVDTAAFEALVRRYQKPVYNIVYRMLHDAEEARDVTQTTFLKTYQNLHRVDPQRKIFSWICRIAINEAVNFRARSRPGVETGREPAAPDADPGDAAQQDEMHRALEAALMELTPELRSVVVLRHTAGMHYSDIAISLEIEEKTVKSRLFRARQLLRQRMKKDGFL